MCFYFTILFLNKCKEKINQNISSLFHVPTWSYLTVRELRAAPSESLEVQLARTHLQTNVARPPAGNAACPGLKSAGPPRSAAGSALQLSARGNSSL